MQDILGHGTYGTVTKEFDTHLDRHVAVKTISKASFQQRAKQTKSARQPVDEFDILNRLSHPNILKAHHCHEDTMHFYIACEYVPHPTWFDILSNHGPCEERQTSSLLRQACDAVSYMHDMNVIHRDLKPENVLVNLNKFMLTIIGVGLSKFERSLKTANTVRGSSIVGSGIYTAPEVYVFALRSADGCYTAAVDMWSMGVLAYVSWTGGLPVSVSESSTRQLGKVQTADGFFFDEDHLGYTVRQGHFTDRSCFVQT